MPSTSKMAPFTSKVKFIDYIYIYIRLSGESAQTLLLYVLRENAEAAERSRHLIGPREKAELSSAMIGFGACASMSARSCHKSMVESHTRPPICCRRRRPSPGLPKWFGLPPSAPNLLFSTDEVRKGNRANRATSSAPLICASASSRRCGPT